MRPFIGWERNFLRPQLPGTASPYQLYRPTGMMNRGSALT